MALNREDSCRRYEDGGTFVKSLLYYTGDYSGKTKTWNVYVLAEEVPTTPTDAELYTVADAQAQTLYDNWKVVVDAANTKVDSTGHTAEIDAT